MGKQFVKDLKAGSKVQSHFVVADVKELPFSSPSKSGELFLKLQLGDSSGTIKGIIWDRSMVTEPILADDVLYVSGEVEDYRGLQLVIDCYEKTERGRLNRSYLQPTCSRDIGEMWCSLLRAASENVEEPHLKDLLELFFSDKELVEKFNMAPAARIIHHNYLGGLLEHTLEVVHLCLHMAELYPEQLDRSLLFAAAVFHDIGKIEEYDVNSYTFQRTDRGCLLGHITIGLETLRNMLNRLTSFPVELKSRLEHMMVSHHGERKWGALEVPHTFDAFALFHADFVSARLKQFSQAQTRQSPGGSKWTEWDRFLERRIYTG